MKGFQVVVLEPHPLDQYQSISTKLCSLSTTDDAGTQSIRVPEMCRGAKVWPIVAAVVAVCDCVHFLHCLTMVQIPAHCLKK